MVEPLTVAPGVLLWRGWFNAGAQRALLDQTRAGLAAAPLYRPVMPRTAKPFSVEQSNFGRLGWVSDKKGYRYQTSHPVTGAPWPAIPPLLTALWDNVAPFFGEATPLPDCCLVNLYRGTARMGLHQDRDEKDISAPVVGVSLGDEALFRIGGVRRGGPSISLALASGDVIAFGGVARLAYHGIDRIRPGTSRLLAEGGRLSLTLRAVGPG
jgi:alkylated DNA repair protein (DNA oxidative demethylase)